MSDDTFWSGPREFALTRWSLVGRAGEKDAPGQPEALDSLCRAYWYPVYAFIRRKGHGADDARDLTQDFLSSWIAGPALGRADRTRGKFRTFLLSALGDFLVDRARRDRALKRGGGVSDIHLDGLEMEARYRLEPLTEESPEKLYDRQFAATVIGRAMDRLREEAARSGRPDFALALAEQVMDDLGDGVAEEIGRRFGLTAGAVSAALYRQRQRFRACLRAEVEETVGSEADLEAEMRELFSALVEP